ncbi:hypothetical protein DZA28_21090 [Pseudomonas alloputida]|uniref:Uncharacterized protein n=1 Tax=Pseudomonas alloputida TaxID=1940621 RepID=A0ABY3D9V0_9PSED|nr:hypothetical protein [Pseudomonas alloputida]TRZ62302.1 hypothetical protein DZA28_21090 [Pseudomonas alloputida]
MPVITVKTTITTRFEIPEGLSIDMIRHQTLPVLSEDEEGTDEVGNLQDTALNMVFLGDAEAQSRTVEHSIVEGGDHP